MSNIAAVETGFCEREKIGGENDKWMVLQVAESESLITRCMEGGGAKCLSVNETFTSKVY